MNRPVRLAAAVAALTVLTALPAQAISGGAADARAHLARLDIGDGELACSGVLIAPRWLVSASSCFAQPGEGLNVPGGAPRKATKATLGTQTVAVEHLVPRTDRNLVLARLASPVTAAPVAGLASAAPAPGSTVRAFGFGRTSTEWVPTTPHAAEFTLASVGAGTLNLDSSTAGVCKGDSGGPTLAGDLLVGVHAASWQNGCLGETGTRTGAVDARVDDIREWVLGQVLDVKATPLRKHAVSLSWQAAPVAGVTGYKVFGARTPGVALTEANLLGTATGTSFTHGTLPAKQTWFYRVVPVAGGQHAFASAEVSATVRVRTSTDFTGDGRDDVATFLRGGDPKVYVGTAQADKKFTAGPAWHDFFAAGGETPLSGDFNGDGKADIVTFVQGGSGKVHVALSDGTRFGPGQEWHPGFGYGTDIPYTGDFNGDGKDDIIVFNRGDSGDVWVSLSDGTKFLPASKWHEYFAPGGEFPAVGDFNGDGKDDIVTFTKGNAGVVYVSLSTGSGFVQDNAKWHNGFGYGTDIPAVGDFNGDGKDDIIVFNRGDSGDVWVSPNMGGWFGGASRWHEYFAPGAELPGVGDFDGDGKTDAVTFTSGGTADVYVTQSTGSGFVQDDAKWNDHFAPAPEVPLPSRVF